MLSYIKTLKKHYKTEHPYKDPFKVLISCLISQRTRDSVTYPAAERLFKRYSSPESMSKANVKTIASLIKPAGFYRQKAKRIKKIAAYVSKYGVPDSVDELLKLPGIGRKCANIVLAYGFGKPAIAVDTHVNRISKRLGLVPWNSTPNQTEQALKKMIPKRYWNDVNTLFVKHGQEICKPINPKCDHCPLRSVCSYANQKHKN